jgi:prepilin-type processing-associated H-X9-DG protein
MSNLRQIGVTVALYTTDHTGLLPEAWNASSGVSYATILEPYLSQATDRVKHDRKNIFVCPGNTLPVAEGSAGIITYSMNVVLGSGTVRLMQIPSPSTTFLFTDGTQITANRNLSSASIYEPWQLFWGSNPEEVVPTTQDADGTAAGWIRYRHGGAANFLMVDGHVEAIKKGSLLSKNGGMMGL